MCYTSKEQFEIAVTYHAYLRHRFADALEKPVLASTLAPREGVEVPRRFAPLIGYGNQREPGAKPPRALYPAKYSAQDGIVDATILEVGPPRDLDLRKAKRGARVCRAREEQAFDEMRAREDDVDYDSEATNTPGISRIELGSMTRGG